MSGTGNGNSQSYTVNSFESDGSIRVNQTVTAQTVTATAHKPVTATFDSSAIALKPVVDGATTTVDFSGSTITRTDGLSWADTTFAPARSSTS